MTEIIDAGDAGFHAVPNVTRIAETIELLATIGSEEGGGVTRLAFTAQERAAHALMIDRMEGLGLEVTVDAFGNTFGLRQGQNASLPPLAFGSHVDTVPHGGRYDGTTGTVAALEVMRILDEANHRTEHPLLMVIFAAEEGARFGLPNLGSRALIGELGPDHLTRLRDAHGTRLADVMRSAGFDPDEIERVRWSGDRVHAFLELHVEQGQVLEAERTPIGLVETIAGSTRLRFAIDGRAVHSGATPMHLRHDALAAASELILGVEEAVSDYRHRTTVATVGRVEVEPNSITTIAGHVVVYVDVRDIDGERQRETANRILDLGRRMEEKRGVRIEAEILSDASPAILPVWIRRITSAACQSLGVSYRVMPSGAGHDAAVLSSIVPAGMIFVPSRDGISHAPEEWTNPEDIATGTNVLLRSLMALDRFLAC